MRKTGTLRWILVISMIAGMAQAAFKTWEGTVNTNFSTAENWSPSDFVAGDRMFFTNTSPVTGTSLNNDLATNTIVGGFTLAGADTPSYILSGNPIKLGGYIDCSGTVNDQVVSFDIDINQGNNNNVRNITTPVDPASITFNGSFTGIGGIQLLAAGTGPLILAGNSTFGGKVILNNPTVCIARNNNALGASEGEYAYTTVWGGASLQLENNVTIAEPIFIRVGTAAQGALQSNSGYTNTLTGLITYANNAVIVSRSDSMLVIDVPSGDAIAGQTYNMDIRGAGDTVINDPISGTGNYLAHGDSGSLTLAAMNTFSNQMRIDLGVVIADTLADEGAPSSLGTGGNDPIIRMGWRSNAGGTLRYIGAAGSTDRQIQIGYDAAADYTAGGTIENNGTGALSFTAAAFNSQETNASAPRTLTLGGSNTDDNVIQGIFADNNTTNGATIALAKTGAGKWILSGSNTYSGGTTVSAGTLVADADSALGAGSVTVEDGASLVLRGGTTDDYINNETDLALGTNAALNLDFSGTDTVLTLSLDGGATLLSAGTYSAAQLSSLGSGTYTGSGSLEVTSAVPAGDGYESWAADWGVDIGAATNDYDGDGLINLYEYGLGGDPTNGSDQGISPSFGPVNVGGTNYFVYIYPQLAARQNSGLSYSLELTTNLVSPNWTNAGYLVYGTNVTDEIFDYVTNVTTTVDNQKFIRLIIE